MLVGRDRCNCSECVCWGGRFNFLFMHDDSREGVAAAEYVFRLVGGRITDNGGLRGWVKWRQRGTPCSRTSYKALSCFYSTNAQCACSKFTGHRFAFVFVPDCWLTDGSKLDVLTVGAITLPDKFLPCRLLKRDPPWRFWILKMKRTTAFASTVLYCRCLGIACLLGIRCPDC